MAQPEARKSISQYLYLLLLGGFILAIWVGTSIVSLPSEETSAVASNCDLTQERCQVDMGNISLTLDIQPHEIRSLTPLNYQVSIEGTDTSQVMIDLQGSEMYMGINQTELSPVAGKPGVFEGKGELAVCTTGEMKWRLTVSAKTDAGQLKTWFEFRAK